ncbi:MAG: DNA alkylation repair protein [Chloroflexi bacterium]|nr:MAG: DNA alkylation repair protein [Chloroflexota bacterium]MBL1196294.1 DNA alkylation repair protein [Chloroflexota bacterium]NOH13589.1 DNA alkylation repair protein [Chloroflexota bacterium]
MEGYLAAVFNANQFIERIQDYQSAEQLKKYERAFPVDKRHGDEFIGVPMGQVFSLAKEFIEMPLDEIEKLLESPIHEVRVGAVSIMDWQARRKSTSDEDKKNLFDLYIRRHDRINNWDLVDRSAIFVVGAYLFDKPRDILYKLARSKNIWERRTAIVSTAYFLRQNDLEDTFKIAELLLYDDEDLIHKPVGSWLREAGKKDRQRLVAFLDEHAAKMPRVTLRFAIEHFDKSLKQHYMEMKNVG